MSRKLTHEEYVERVGKINTNIEVLGEYVGAKTRILHRCKIDNYEWMAAPSNILQGTGCPVCAGTIKKTQEEYINEVAQINSNIEVVGEYVNIETKILHRCKICNYEWMTTPDGVLRGRSCPKCAGIIKKTHEEYVDELNIVNPNIEVIGEYVNINTRTLHRCRIDGYEWMVLPNDLLSGHGCPRCCNKERYDTKRYIDVISKINPNIEVIGEYKNANTRILHRCKIDGYEWSVYPSHILRGCGCPVCAGLKKKTQEEYINELSNVNSNIEVVGVYSGANNKILHRCKKCGCEWDVAPHSILQGNGCPKCRESKGEKMIRKWLENHSVEYIYQMPFDNCRDIKPLPFDFYLSKLNICIEYDGIQHFEPINFSGKGEEWAKQQLEYVQRHDKIKNEYCKKNNIKLLRIPYFKNIEEELLKLYKLIKVKEVIV